MRRSANMWILINHHGRDPGINSEFAGPTFSRDGRILFVNIYAGWILAVTGPWQ